MKRIYRIGIDLRGSTLVETSDRQLGLPTTENELRDAILDYIRTEMTDKELMDAMNLDEPDVLFVDEYTDKEVLIE